MFTEQPAPPNPIVHVQPAQTEVVVPTKIVSVEQVANRVAPPETIAPQVPVFRATVEKAAVEQPPEPQPSPQPAELAPAPPVASNSSAEATAKRRQEVEQTLLELTNKARAKQKEEQQQQAATEAAKYAESGDFQQAEQAAQNPTLPPNLRDRLLKQVQAKQAQKKNTIATKQPAKASAKGTQPTPSTTPAAGQFSAPEYLNRPRGGYAATPIIPLSEAELRLRYGKLIGRHLNFAYPLSAPAPVTSMFGWRIHPISGDSRFHRGIDLGAPYGTPVVAAKTGRIEVAGDLSGYGLTVTVQHSNSQQTLYAHLSQIYVKPGQTVQKGQLLGLVGSTGNSTGPHLHFELHQLTAEGWTALDPAIALHSAIALAEKPLVPSLAKGKPQTFNLALSGLLEINSPDVIDLPLPFSPPRMFGVSDFVSSTLTRATEPFRPFALLPTVLTEFSWLIPPFPNNWVAKEPTPPVPVIQEPEPTLALQPMPMLEDLPTSSRFQSVATVEPQSSQLQLASITPLAGVMVLEPELQTARVEAVPSLKTQSSHVAFKPQLAKQPQKALPNSNPVQKPFVQKVASLYPAFQHPPMPAKSELSAD